MFTTAAEIELPTDFAARVHLKKIQVKVLMETTWKTKYTDPAKKASALANEWKPLIAEYRTLYMACKPGASKEETTEKCTSFYAKCVSYP